MEQILAACEPYLGLYHRAKELAEAVKADPESVRSIGDRMELNLLHGQAMSKKKWDEEGIKRGCCQTWELGFRS